ncbi:MAG: hypothetical protein HY286_01645 [Planctomycetes bacterium]|nr:hypothetical protein [Planctomycetota bacterium]
MIGKRTTILRTALFFMTIAAARARCQTPPAIESDYYKLITIQSPPGELLEVGGIDTIGGDRIAVCTRRGDVFIVENAYSDKTEKIKFHKFASGLHEPLGLLNDGDSLLCVQRGELTRLSPLKPDSSPAAKFTTVCDAWSISGNYHEYAYGPKRDKNGDLWITLNLSWTDAGRSLVPFRGWAVKINKKGEMIPMCAGLRSPSGLGMNAEGDMFYTDNQGDWNAVCNLHQLVKGEFMGHPEGLKWWDLAKFDPPIPRPPQPPATEDSMYQVAKAHPELRLNLPAIWFPYPKMGQSASDIVCDQTGGKFGPFDKQLFIGDQTTSEIFRVYLEKVNGKYQGAAFPFRQGLSCGIVRLCWGADGSLFIGETNRGWGSRGSREDGLERLVWNGTVPFEILEMHAASDGFDLKFTKPVDAQSIKSAGAFSGTSYTFHYHERYGSEEIYTEPLKIEAVATGASSARLKVSEMRPGFVYELHANGVRSKDGAPLAHAAAYYTLNEIPAANPAGK